MLPKEENQIVTRVGPGTPMGNTLRRYWLPALLASEIPGPDCAPVSCVSRPTEWSPISSVRRGLFRYRMQSSAAASAFTGVASAANAAAFSRFSRTCSTVTPS